MNREDNPLFGARGDGYTPIVAIGIAAAAEGFYCRASCLPALVSGGEPVVHAGQQMKRVDRLHPA